MAYDLPSSSYKSQIEEKPEDWTLRAFPQSESWTGMTVALDLILSKIEWPGVNQMAFNMEEIPSRPIPHH